MVRINERMRILMLSWRDMKHLQKGGAEIVTDIYLSGLAKLGHEVVLFSAEFPNCKKEESYNNYKIVRKGGQLSVHYFALIYAKKHEKEFDIIIDQINTIPFLTPVFIKKSKRVAFFHQLCMNIWFYESKFPVSLAGFILEHLYLKFYKNTRAFSVSESTKKDLIKYANMKESMVLTLENQIDFNPVTRIKEKENYFVYVGRLTKSKRVHHIIRAFSMHKTPNLIIIGNGNERYKQQLDSLIKKLNLNARVIFTGSISNDERNKIMQKAQAIIVTSVREGWGLIVTEANANGTMAITYNTHGLRDANTTGIITKENTPEAIAKEIDFIVNNPKIMKEKSNLSLVHARAHNNWQKNIEILEGWLKSN